MVAISSYRDGDFDGIRALWSDVFPGHPAWNRAEAVIPAKLSLQPDLLLVARDGERVVGTVMAGYDGHRGWLYALAVATSHRRREVGSNLVREAEARLKALGCVKVNLQVRAANEGVAAFYRRLGYEVEERISMGRRL